MSSPGTVSFTSRLNHKFYEPLVLLNALNVATRNTAVAPNAEASINTCDDEEVFQAFVYKLAHVCDSEKGEFGATITAFYVLRDQDTEDLVHYWFASNQRTHEELEATKAYVENLISQVNNAPEDVLQQKPVFRALLSGALIFNRRRVTYYISQMMMQANKCINVCVGKLDETNRAISDSLKKLVHMIGFDSLTNTSDQAFTGKCFTIVGMLERLQLSASGPHIAQRAATGRMTGVPSDECWSSLQHMINRTLAYSQSVRFMLKAKGKWPALFNHFDVSFYESSERMSRPVRNKSQTADAIVGRMTRKADIMKTFRNYVQDLQMFDLDTLIREEYRRETFRPVVHCEVLLLDQLEKKGLLNQRFFFNEWMYVGSSKPTCKLCDHYFECHPSKIGRRPTHGNLYLSWRFPDVLTTQGVEGIQKRQDMYERVLLKVRKDAFDIVKRKTPSSYKGEDSFTYSAALTVDWLTDRGSNGDVDDLASMLGQVDLE
ncbi:hypothetical protein B0J13DRAFT_550724 [Dactylonectria estremocensis]|uniref:Uncharacterized protein n=1 Tax=Dactylonectria estremocensis TaxID=1079267 RepID=A0A9P9EZL0_9HYPO|nr:hypothetical protein B0J13DRAFT_550724 [Dactylonectria estremocensis]